MKKKREKFNFMETGVGNDMTTMSKRKKTTLPSRRIDKIERFHGNTERQRRWGRGLKRKTAAESSLCCVLPSPPPPLVKTRSRGGRRGCCEGGPADGGGFNGTLHSSRAYPSHPLIPRSPVCKRKEGGSVKI